MKFFNLVCLFLSLAPLVSKVKEPQVETMVDVLCSNMTSDKEQLRDISSMGLKTVIAELPLTSSGERSLSSHLSPRRDDQLLMVDFHLMLKGQLREYEEHQ